MTQGKPHTLAPEDCFLPVNGIAPQSEDRQPLRIDRCYKSMLFRIEVVTNRCLLDPTIDRTTFAFRCAASLVGDEGCTSSVEVFLPLDDAASRS